jgi:hypothetical protein
MMLSFSMLGSMVEGERPSAPPPPPDEGDTSSGPETA